MKIQAIGHWLTGLGVAMLLISSAAAVTADKSSLLKPDGRPHQFTFGGPDNSEFLLDGQPIQIRSGEMHPDRMAPAQWRYRLRQARAAGLNAVAIYVFWNAHERTEGRYDFSSPGCDLGAFLKLAREEGMWVLLRPGPYCCGERDFGGIPPYLLRYPDLKLRTLADSHYTNAVANYFHELARVVRPQLAENGGPILMVQLENEYGSYPRRDHAYLVWLRDLWLKNGVRGPFYTADGPGEHYLKGVTVTGVAIGLDTGKTEEHFAIARRLNPGVPVFSSEAYPGWLRHWGDGYWSPNDLPPLIKFYMDTGKSFNLYMFSGGTCFGFTAGANTGGHGYEPDVTSYDYASPVNEQGVTTSAYHALRRQISAYLPKGTVLPAVPDPVPAMAIPPIPMKTWSSLWNELPKPRPVIHPECFEAVGQYQQGLMVYRTRIAAGDAGRLVFTNLHDYGQVFVDGAFIGTLDRRLGQREIELPARNETATLEVLVEAMGHINFTGAMESDRKGIYGPVTLAGLPLTGWEMLALPLTDDWAKHLKSAPLPFNLPGGIFRGEFKLAQVADTYFDLSQYRKGVIWVNGHNLGRYWNIGPQQRLYCPAAWLQRGNNTVLVLDLILNQAPPLEGKPAVR